VCGLFGVVGAPPGLLDRGRVERLLALLHHRGPDDRGWLALDRDGIRTGSAAEDLAGDVVLLHTRLSILDLSPAGHQPMSTPDGRLHLSFNGEIYNYVELRRELESLGREFASGSDTEVLLAAWAEWGAAALERLVGMFAFALVDSERRVVVLARDHFGIKPLYYAPLQAGLAFASEIPPLLELPGVERRGNPQRVYDYLRFGRIDHGAETMFAGIRQLQPAHYAELPLDRPEGVVERPYWRLEPEPLDGLSLDEAAGRLRGLFLDNVRIHLRSDVPVGAAFSGGVDSSANVTAMRHVSGGDLDLQAFSFVPEDPALSERRWMELVARETGTSLHTVTPTPQELRDDLDELIAVQGEPFGSTSIYAQCRVFRLAREHRVKVMLDGQGADELFAGYRHYLPARLAGLVAHGRLADAGRFLSVLRTLPGASPGKVVSWAVGAALPAAAQAPVRRLSGRPLVPEWLDADWLASRGVGLGDPWRDSGGTTLREQRLVSVQSTLRTLLRYEDRNSMASSIESRVPFLTPALAEFAVGMPDDYLIAADGTGKLVLRQGLRGLVPDPILDRRDKIGFATPEESWLRTLGPWVDGVLGSDAARAAGPLRTAEVRKRWEIARDGRNGIDPATWRWLNLIRWADQLGVALD
jgi:asparagine synthase (glutamine-hydrolysing)